MFKSPSIGAFYQCYKRPEAVISALSSFRKYYHEASIYMVCDGGFDYKQLASYFGCEYEYDTKHEGNGKTTIFDTKEKLLNWLKRLRKAAEVIKEDYILIMEDDVLVLNQVKGPLNYTVNGINPDVRLGMRITKMLKKRNKSIPFWKLNYYWGGFGGCIVDRKFILENFNDNLDKDFDYLKKYSNVDTYTTDAWLSIFTLFYGGTIGQYSGLCETWWKSYKERMTVLHDIEILHQYKEIYGKALSVEDKKILGQSFNFLNK